MIHIEILKKTEQTALFSYLCCKYYSRGNAACVTIKSQTQNVVSQENLQYYRSGSAKKVVKSPKALILQSF